MYLQKKDGGYLVEIIDLRALFDPHESDVGGRAHYGEEVQEAEPFRKSDLEFPSGEALPRCWSDPHYRDTRR